MLDHITLGVADLGGSIAFYDAALAPLGVTRLWFEAGAFAGYGAGDKPYFYVGARETAGGPTHVAFLAESRAAVDEFHAAALGAGGRDNGAPGLRPEYHPGYYAAFVLDPDGNNIEAVRHTAE